MVQRPDLAGGLDQVATVACGLVEHGLLDPEILASQALTYPETVRRRAGHILDEAVAALDMTGVACDSGPLASTLTARAAVTPLMPVGAENCAVAGQAAFRYSLMSPPQRAVLTT